MRNILDFFGLTPREALQSAAIGLGLAVLGYVSLVVWFLID